MRRTRSLIARKAGQQHSRSRIFMATESLKRAGNHWQVECGGGEGPKVGTGARGWEIGWSSKAVGWFEGQNTEPRLACVLAVLSRNNNLEALAAARMWGMNENRRGSNAMTVPSPCGLSPSMHRVHTHTRTHPSRCIGDFDVAEMLPGGDKLMLFSFLPTSREGEFGEPGV